jgi:hypothetical protein
MFIQAELELAHTGIPITSKPASAGLTRYTRQRAAGTAPRSAAGRVLIVIQPATLTLGHLAR